MAITADQLKVKLLDKGYEILLNNVPWYVQEDYFPCPGKDVAESAQHHMKQILADQAASAKAEADAQTKAQSADVLGKQVAALVLSDTKKDALIKQMGTQMTQMQLTFSKLTSKGGTY